MRTSFSFNNAIDIIAFQCFTIKEIKVMRRTSIQFQDVIDNHSHNTWNRLLQVKDIDYAFDNNDIYLIEIALRTCSSKYNFSYRFVQNRNSNRYVDDLMLKYGHSSSIYMNQTSLTHAYSKFDYKRINYLITSDEQGKIDVNQRRTDGFSLLMLLVMRNETSDSSETFELLMNRKDIDINMKLGNGLNAFHLAVSHQQYRQALLLLKAGSSIIAETIYHLLHIDNDEAIELVNLILERRPDLICKDVLISIKHVRMFSIFIKHVEKQGLKEKIFNEHIIHKLRFYKRNEFIELIPV